MERLFDYLEIKNEEGTGQDRAGHRLYGMEIIEMAPDVSLVVVFPPSGIKIVLILIENDTKYGIFQIMFAQWLTKDHAWTLKTDPTSCQ